MSHGTVKFRDYDAKDIIKFMVWFADEFAKHETVDAFRKGVCYVEDIGGFTLANLDTGNSKHLVEEFGGTLSSQDIFPIKPINPEVK